MSSVNNAVALGPGEFFLFNRKQNWFPLGTFLVVQKICLLKLHRFLLVVKICFFNTLYFVF